MQASAASIAGVDDLEDALWGIINVQTFQIHKFRNYLGSYGLAEGSICTTGSCAPGYFCSCPASARNLLFGSVPTICTCKAALGR